MPHPHRGRGSIPSPTWKSKPSKAPLPQLVLMLPFSGVRWRFWFPPALPSPRHPSTPRPAPIFPRPSPPHDGWSLQGASAGGLGSGGNEEDKICEPSRRDTVISASLAALRVMDGRSTPTQGPGTLWDRGSPPRGARTPPLTTELKLVQERTHARARGGAQTHTHIRTLSLYGAPPRSTALRPHTRQTNSPFPHTWPSTHLAVPQAHIWDCPPSPNTLSADTSLAHTQTRMPLAQITPYPFAHLTSPCLWTYIPHPGRLDLLAPNPGVSRVLWTTQEEGVTTVKLSPLRGFRTGNRTTVATCTHPLVWPLSGSGLAWTAGSTKPSV